MMSTRGHGLGASLGLMSLLGGASTMALGAVLGGDALGRQPEATMPTPHLVAEDPATDSGFGPNNELTALKVGFDDETLSIAFDYTIESNAIIFYIDLGLPGGVNDFAQGRGYTGAYPTMVTLGAEVDAFLGTYGSGNLNLYRALDKSSQDISSSAQLFRTSYKEDGTPGVGRANIPWSVFFPDGDTPVPPNLRISIAGIIRANDDELPAEYLPDNAGQINAFVDITVDLDGDGSPDPDPLMDLDGDGLSPYLGDCDDTDPDTFPGAEEICQDGIDQDCAQDGDGAGCVTPTPTQTPSETPETDTPETPSPTPLPTPRATPTPTATQTPGQTSVASPTPTSTPTLSQAPTASPTPGTASPTPTAVATPTLGQGTSTPDEETPSPTLGATPSATPTMGETQTPSLGTPSPTPNAGTTPPSPPTEPPPTPTAEDGTPLLYLDVDGDGFTQEDGDCDDLDASRYPGAEEQCDDVVDRDCDDVPGGDCLNNPGIGCDCDHSSGTAPGQLALFLLGAALLWRRPR